MAIDFEPETAAAPKIDFEPETSPAAPKIDFEAESSPTIVPPNEPDMPISDAGPAPAPTPPGLDVATAFEDTVSSNIIGALGGVADIAHDLVAIPGSKAGRPEDQADYDVLLRRRAEMEADLRSGKLTPDQMIGHGAALQQIAHRIDQMAEPPREQTLGGQLGAAADAYRQSAQKVTGAPGALARAGGNVAAAVPLTLAGGTTGLALATTQQVGGAESASRTELYDSLINQGVPESKANEIAAAGGVDAAIKAGITMPAYLLTGKGAAMATAKLLGKTATPLATGVGSFLGASTANVATSATLRAIEGENPTPTLEGTAQDILWGIVHAVPEYANASSLARERAQAELDRRAKAVDEIKSDLTRASTEVKDLAEATGIIPPTGEQDALSQSKTSPSDGGVRSRSELQSVPPEEGGQGIQPSGQGNGNPEQGLARGAPDEAQPNLGPGAANAQEFTPGERLGAYNAQIDEQRAARGLPPLMSEARKPNPQLWDDAVARVERDPEEPAMLTNEINSGKKKSVSDEEQSMLLYRIVDLHNRMDTEAQRVLDPHADEADRVEARVKYERLEQERQATEEADRKAGTASGRSLQARKIMADENYSFAGIMKRVGIASREPISPEKATEIKADAEKVKAAKDKLDEETAKVEGEKEIAKVKGTKAEVPLDEQRAKIAAHLEAEQKKGTQPADLKNFIQKLAENFVKSGVTEINALTKAVHGVVEPIFKGISEREVRDLFSNYGDFHALDKDPLKTELRRLRSEGQSVSKLEDVQSGKAPSKTGVERQAPSDLKRRLEKEVRETMKKNGITTTDPATQLKSSLDARKTAMKNQIKDLTFQIETGEKPKAAEPPPSDADLEGLRRLRDNVRETLQAIEGDPQMSDEQRAKLVIAQLDRQIAEHQRIIDSGAVKQEGGKRKLLTTPEIEARRAVRDSLKAQVDEIRAADQTAREERAFDATMARADELEKRLASGDLSTKGGKELGPDTELVAAAKERLAKLQKELSERRKALRPKATEEERQLSALERQKEDLHRRLDTGDLSTHGSKLGPDTQKVAEAKAEVQKLRDEIKARRDALNPKKTVEEIQLARLEKTADDLEERLTKGDLSRKEKAPTVDTKEVSEAKDRLAALRDQLKAARAASPEATQAKLDASKTAVEESIAKLDKRIQAEDFSSSKKAQPTTPEIEALRAERDALRKLFNELKSATLPKLTPEQRAQKALATRLAKRTAELQAKLAAGDFTKPAPRKPTPLTPALVKAKAGYEEAKLQVDRGIEKLRLKNRSFLEKSADLLAKWTRASILSGPITLAKLTMAAAYRITAIPAEEAAGSALRRAFPRAAARAPFEGRGLEPKLEAKAVAKGVTRGLMDAWHTIKTGHGTLDAAFGKKDIAPRSLLDIFGAIHGALKAPVKRTYFERSMAKRVASASEAGVDVTDPAIQTQIIADAYKDAQRSIFMQDNRVASLVNQMAARLEAPDRKTGKVSFLGKAGATALRVALPVVKVPTNIVAEIFQHVFGLPYGLGRLAREYARGIEKLHPDEADAIFRSLKKGSLGSAMLLYGFFAPSQFGGQYAPGLKKNEDEAGFGELKVGKAKVPKFLIHNPLLETAQVGATIRHVMDQKIKGKTQGLMTGIGRGLLGAVEEAPQFDESVRLAHLTEQNGPTKYFGELARSIGVPQLVQQIARWTDSKKRKPEGFIDIIKEGVPGLRQTVPVKP